MGKPIHNSVEEKDLMRTLGAIAAGEFDRVLLIGEKVTDAGERSLIVRMGGTDFNGARELAAHALWSGSFKEEP